jgi:hypothetical protein
MDVAILPAVAALAGSLIHRRALDSHRFLNHPGTPISRTSAHSGVNEA